MINMHTYRGDIQKHRLLFAGTLVREDETVLLKRIVLGRLVAKNEARRHLRDWGNRLHENLRKLGATSQRGKRRKRFAHGIEIKSPQLDTAAENRGGGEQLEEAQRHKINADQLTPKTRDCYVGSTQVSALAQANNSSRRI